MNKEREKRFLKKSDSINKILDDVSNDEKILILKAITLAELKEQSESNITFLYDVIQYATTFLDIAIDSGEIRNMVFDIKMKGWEKNV